MPSDNRKMTDGQDSGHFPGVIRYEGRHPPQMRLQDGRLVLLEEVQHQLWAAGYQTSTLGDLEDVRHQLEAAGYRPSTVSSILDGDVRNWSPDDYGWRYEALCQQGYTHDQITTLLAPERNQRLIPIPKTRYDIMEELD